MGNRAQQSSLHALRPCERAKPLPGAPSPEWAQDGCNCLAVPAPRRARPAPCLAQRRRCPARGRSHVAPGPAPGLVHRPCRSHPGPLSRPAAQAGVARLWRYSSQQVSRPARECQLPAAASVASGCVDAPEPRPRPVALPATA
ncbi:hypothetical protein Nepgr_033993 [Nepenthes gracilis]|uniref:Uncharacterized protein n=1 Tax=Nepenthes gracilis TaxID=150966 RepID=A0AAD3TMX9_NEPGR|nr:hypothetical protein Nepgr_033993 [Nepenthes gracilis]